MRIQKPATIYADDYPGDANRGLCVGASHLERDGFKEGDEVTVTIDNVQTCGTCNGTRVVEYEDGSRSNCDVCDEREEAGTPSVEHLLAIREAAKEVRRLQKAYWSQPAHNPDHRDEKRVLLVESKGAEAVLDRLLGSDQQGELPL